MELHVHNFKKSHVRMRIHSETWHVYLLLIIVKFEFALIRHDTWQWTVLIVQLCYHLRKPV